LEPGARLPPAQCRRRPRRRPLRKRLTRLFATTNANNALARDIRNQNLQVASPFYNNGVAAGNALQELLLGPNSTAGTPPIAGVGALGGGGSDGYSGGALDAYLAANPDVGRDYSTNPGISHDLFPTPESYAAWHYQHYGQNEGRAAPAVNTPAPTAATGATGGTTGRQRARCVRPLPAGHELPVAL
jgi:hypothetical protein